jgi:hypothetical protein
LRTQEEDQMANIAAALALIAFMAFIGAAIAFVSQKSGLEHRKRRNWNHAQGQWLI